MSKKSNGWHIDINNKEAQCYADVQACPRGGADEHFSNREEARKEADRRGMLKKKGSSTKEVEKYKPRSPNFYGYGENTVVTNEDPSYSNDGLTSYLQGAKVEGDKLLIMEFHHQRNDGDFEDGGEYEWSNIYDTDSHEEVVTEEYDLGKPEELTHYAEEILKTHFKPAEVRYKPKQTSYYPYGENTVVTNPDPSYAIDNSISYLQGIQVEDGKVRIVELHHQRNDGDFEDGGDYEWSDLYDADNYDTVVTEEYDLDKPEEFTHYVEEMLKTNFEQH